MKRKMRHFSKYWQLSSQWGLKMLRCLPPEAAHRLTIHLLKKGFGPLALSSPSRLKSKVRLLHCPNPIGTAAGFDKHAEVISPLSDMGCDRIRLDASLVQLYSALVQGPLLLFQMKQDLCY